MAAGPGGSRAEGAGGGRRASGAGPESRRPARAWPGRGREGSGPGRPGLGCAAGGKPDSSRPRRRPGGAGLAPGRGRAGAAERGQRAAPGSWAVRASPPRARRPLGARRLAPFPPPRARWSPDSRSRARERRARRFPAPRLHCCDGAGPHYGATAAVGRRPLGGWGGTGRGEARGEASAAARDGTEPPGRPRVGSGLRRGFGAPAKLRPAGARADPAGNPRAAPGPPPPPGERGALETRLPWAGARPMRRERSWRTGPPKLRVFSSLREPSGQK